MASSFWFFGSAIFAFAVAAGPTIITGVFQRMLYLLMELYLTLDIMHFLLPKKIHIDYTFCPGKSKCLQTEEI